MTIVYGSTVSPEGWVKTESQRYKEDCPKCKGKKTLNTHVYENKQLEPCTHKKCSNKNCDYEFNNDQFIGA